MLAIDGVEAGRRSLVLMSVPVQTRPAHQAWILTRQALCLSASACPVTVVRRAAYRGAREWRCQAYPLQALGLVWYKPQAAETERRCDLPFRPSQPGQ